MTSKETDNVVFGQNKGSGDDPMSFFRQFLQEDIITSDMFFEDTPTEVWQTTNNPNQNLIDYRTTHWTKKSEMVLDVPFAFQIVLNMSDFGTQVPVSTAVMSQYNPLSTWGQGNWAMLNPLIRFRVRIGDNLIPTQSDICTFQHGIKMQLSDRIILESEQEFYSPLGLPYSIADADTKSGIDDPGLYCITDNSRFLMEHILPEMYYKKYDGMFYDYIRYQGNESEPGGFFPSYPLQSHFAFPIHLLDSSFREGFLPPGTRIRIEFEFNPAPVQIAQTNDTFNSTLRHYAAIQYMNGYTQGICLRHANYHMRKNYQDMLMTKARSTPFLYSYFTYEREEYQTNGALLNFNNVLTWNNQRPYKIIFVVQNNNDSISSLTDNTDLYFTYPGSNATGVAIQHLKMYVNGREVLRDRLDENNESFYEYFGRGGAAVLHNLQKNINNNHSDRVDLNQESNVSRERGYLYTVMSSPGKQLMDNAPQTVSVMDQEQPCNIKFEIKVGQVSQGSSSPGVLVLSPLPTGYKLVIYKKYIWQYKLDVLGEATLYQYPVRAGPSDHIIFSQKQLLSN